MDENRQPPSGRAEIKKVTVGNVKRRKSFLQTLIGDGPIVEYIVMDVLLPALKNTLSEIINSGSDMILFGETRRARRGGSRGTATYTSYSDYYGKDRGSRPAGRDTRDRVRSSHKFDDLVFDTRDDAEEVLSTLVELIEQYESVTVSEFYNLMGLNPEWSDYKYGWENLGRSEILRVRDGYILSLPKPIVLD